MRIVVMGAGIMGLASAFELLQDGHEVTVLEAAPAPGKFDVAGAQRGVTFHRIEHRRSKVRQHSRYEVEDRPDGDLEKVRGEHDGGDRNENDDMRLTSRASARAAFVMAEIAAGETHALPVDEHGDGHRQQRHEKLLGVLEVQVPKRLRNDFQHGSFPPR